MCDASSRQADLCSPANTTSAAACALYRVSYLGGINLRCRPSVLSPGTGVCLKQHDVIEVSEEVSGLDGRIYLRLKDGRGWAFDDSKLMPQDPSVVRCTLQSTSMGWFASDWETDAITGRLWSPGSPNPSDGQLTIPPSPTNDDVEWKTLYEQGPEERPQLQELAVPMSCPAKSFHRLSGATLTSSTASGASTSEDHSELGTDQHDDQDECTQDDTNRCTVDDGTASCGSCPDTEYDFDYALPTASWHSDGGAFNPASPAPVTALYRVAYLGGVMIRSGPSVTAPTTGVRLLQNDIIAVSDEIPGSDCRIYLRLADGSGWAFDDSLLVPHDPSCVRGHWKADLSDNVPAPAMTAHVLSTAPLVHAAAVAPEAAKKKQRRRRKTRRRKRGAALTNPSNIDGGSAPSADDDVSEAESVGSAPSQLSNAEAQATKAAGVAESQD